MQSFDFDNKWPDFVEWKDKEGWPTHFVDRALEVRDLWQRLAGLFENNGNEEAIYAVWSEMGATTEKFGSALMFLHAIRDGAILVPTPGGTIILPPELQEFIERIVNSPTNKPDSGMYL